MLREPNKSTAETFQTLQDALWAYGDMKLLAENTGLSANTLYRYRSAGYENYPWPRQSTWAKLLPVLGLKLKLVKDED